GLEVATCGARSAVARGDDLALFGDTNASTHSSLWLRQNSIVSWPATATYCATATVRKAQADAMFVACLDDGQLGIVKRPVSRQIATLLIRIGIAQGELLNIISPA